MSFHLQEDAALYRTACHITSNLDALLLYNKMIDCCLVAQLPPPSTTTSWAYSRDFGTRLGLSAMLLSGVITVGGACLCAGVWGLRFEVHTKVIYRRGSRQLRQQSAASLIPVQLGLGRKVMMLLHYYVQPTRWSEKETRVSYSRPEAGLPGQQRRVKIDEPGKGDGSHANGRGTDQVW